ncbi:MAG: regulatory protein GemA [Sphingopyxis terrae]|nr:regulatory protein GemA [Sphingopyxis terrae]
MSAAIKMIHVAKRELGMDDDDYRAVLDRATRGAATSLRAMTDGQLQLVIGEMKKLGFVPSSPTGTSRKVKGPFAPKLLALWLSGWNLGIVHSREDQALIHFVERQTGIAHVQWLRDPRDAAKAIDGLKLWIAREAGVEWPKSTGATGRELKVAVIAAQHRLLGLGEHYRDSAEISDAQLDKIIGALGAKIRGAKNG